nr:Eco57I restriction-modification methylase domain-containing protein [Candidatus Microthrix sp.]
MIDNPPYVRLENVEQQTMDDYRKVCPTMRGRADIYVGFIERGLDLLKPGGTLSFICADRWMRNQYGADLRSLITSDYAVDTVVSMHDVDAFEHDVSAYPAIIVLRNEQQRQTAVVEANAKFSEPHAPRLASWVRGNNRTTLAAPSYGRPASTAGLGTGSLADRFSGTSSPSLPIWSPRFPPLQDEATRNTRRDWRCNRM